MGRQYKVRYKLAWPGIRSLPIYIIDADDMVYGAENRLPSNLGHLNRIENQYVKLSDVMDLMVEAERYPGSICLNKLIIEFNMRGLKTIASLSSTVFGQQVIIDQYLPLTTLLPFLLVYPSKVFTAAFQCLIQFLDTYLDTVCFSCGFINRSCNCGDGITISDGDEAIGYAISYCDREVQTEESEPPRSTPAVSPPPPLKCMEEMSRSAIADGPLRMPTHEGAPGSDISSSTTLGDGGSFAMAGVKVRLPNNLNLPPGIRMPLTMVQNAEIPYLMPDVNHQSPCMPPPCSIPNMMGLLPYAGSFIGGVGMMNYANQQLPVGQLPGTGYPSVSCPPYYPPTDMSAGAPDLPFPPTISQMSAPDQMPPSTFGNVTLTSSYSMTAYDPGTSPATMGPPRGQVVVKLPKYINPRYINTTLGTFKRMGATRNIGIQVDIVMTKRKGSIGNALERGSKKPLLKIKLGKYHRHGLKKDAISRAVDKIKQIQRKTETSEADPCDASVENEDTTSVIEDGKVRASSRRMDKVWRMIIDDEESNEEEEPEKKCYDQHNDTSFKLTDGNRQSIASQPEQPPALQLSDACRASEVAPVGECDVIPSDTETIGAEDQSEDAVKLDEEYNNGKVPSAAQDTEAPAIDNHKTITEQNETPTSLLQKADNVRKHFCLDDSTDISETLLRDQMVISNSGSALETNRSLDTENKNCGKNLSIGWMAPQQQASITDMDSVADGSSSETSRLQSQTGTTGLSPIEEIQKRTLAAEVLGSLATFGQLDEKLTASSVPKEDEISKNGDRTCQENTSVGSKMTHPPDKKDEKGVLVDVLPVDANDESEVVDEEVDKSDLIIDEDRSESVQSPPKVEDEVEMKNSCDLSMDSLLLQARNPNIDHEKKYFAKFEHLPTGEKLYKCIYPRCLQCFDTRTAAKLHNQCHSKDESVRFLLCLSCDYKTPFFRWFDLLRHLRETHKVGLTSHPNGCLFCGLEFESQECLARHLEFHYSSRYKCVHCGLMMMSWSQVKLHVDGCPEKNQVKVNFGCPYCMFVFHKKTIRNLHMLSHSDNGLTCALCEDADVNWQHWKLLRKHYQTRHSKALMAKIGPFRHLLPRKKRSPKCPVCGIEFKAFDLYSIHVIKVHDLVPFTLLACQLCDKSFRTKRRLDYHVKNTHEEEMACAECDYVAKNKTFLKLHISQKHTEKQHVCTECGKSFVYYHQLRIHMAHHARKIVHTCRHCNQEFTRSAELRKHIAEQHALPTDRKTYNCSQCDYWTYAKSTLAYHVQKKHRQVQLDSDLEHMSQEGRLREVNESPDGLVYHDTRQPGQRKRELPQENSLTPNVGKRKRRKKLTMPTRRVAVARLHRDATSATSVKPLKCWIPEKPVRNRDERKRIRLEQIEQKRLKKMRKHSCARTRSMEEQKAIRDDLEMDLLDPIELAKSHADGKKFIRSISRDESMIVNLSYPYIDHNYYQLETQADFSTFKSPHKAVGRKYSHTPDFGRVPVSMSVVATPRVCGFEECETSPGEEGSRSKTRDVRRRAKMSSKQTSQKQFSSNSNGPFSSTPMQNAGSKLQSPVQIRSLLSRALQTSPSSSASRTKASMLSQQLKSIAMESPSLEDFPELIGEASEILPEQDLGLITDILNSIDTSGINISGKTSDGTASSQDISLPLVTQNSGMEAMQATFTDGDSGQFLEDSKDNMSLPTSSLAASSSGSCVGERVVPKLPGSNQTSTESSFDDAILETTRADLASELPTDIDEIELKEADYRLWHSSSRTSGEEKELGESLANAQISVEFQEAPVSATTAPVSTADIQSEHNDNDVNQSSSCLLDHQYC